MSFLTVAIVVVTIVAAGTVGVVERVRHAGRTKVTVTVDVPCPACRRYFEVESDKEEDVTCSCPECGHRFTFDVDYDPVAGFGVIVKEDRS
jgi:hypothetical protein